MKNTEQLITQEGFVLEFRERELEELTMKLPKEVLISLEQVANKRGLSIQALLEFYIGQNLRQDISNLFTENISEKTKEVLSRHPQSKEELDTEPTKYFLFLENEEIGYSLLEKRHSNLNEVSGEFYPNENYQKYSTIFAEYTKLKWDFPENKKDKDIRDKRQNEVFWQVRGFKNREIVSENGEKIKVHALWIEDHSLSGFNLPMRVEVYLLFDIYEKFFAE